MICFSEKHQITVFTTFRKYKIMILILILLDVCLILIVCCLRATSVAFMPGVFELMSLIDVLGLLLLKAVLIPF